MMSRSKKGFKRLNTHEMVELNSNGQRGDSGSESEILDLTTVDERESHNTCSSCCLWFGVLYAGILTVLLLLMGTFSGYIFMSMWQLNQENNSTSSSIQEDLQQLRGEFDTHTRDTFYILNGLKQTTFTVNDSFSALNLSTNATLMYLMQKVEEFDLRMKTMEARPREVLSEQVNAIHDEMAQLDIKMQKLNSSLDELQDMRREMASMGSMLDEYQDQLHGLSTSVGDAVHTNTVMQDAVQGFSDNIGNFSSWLTNLDSQISSAHDKMHQTADLTTAEFSNLQSLVAAMNESMTEEMGGLWGNLSKVEMEIDELRTEVHTFAENISSLAEKNKMDTSKPLDSVTEPVTTSATTMLPLPSTSSESTTTDEATLATQTTQARIRDEPHTTIKGEEENLISNTKGGGSEGRSEAGSEGGSSPESTEATEHFPSSDSDSDHSTGGVSTSNDNATVASTATDTTESTTAEEKGGQSSSAVSTLQDILDNFIILDVNGDGQLSYTEFSYQLHARKVFDMLDRDHDGFLSREELETAMMLLSRNRSSDLSQSTG